MTERDELPLILASASPRRHELLRSAGIPFEGRPAQIEEVGRPGETPEAMARRLARQKALAVARGAGGCPPRLVLGADTVVVVDHDVLGKPRDAVEAESMLGRLVGRTHRVVTGVALVCSSDLAVRECSVESQVRMRPATADEIRAYVATGEPLDKAGAYAVQGMGRTFVDRIDGSESNVIGLPLEATLDLLREARWAAPRGGPLAERLDGVLGRIARAAERSGREPREIRLVGVSKRKPATLVVEAVRAGLGDVGENYVQEAARKLPEVRSGLARLGVAPPRFHFVGHLQRNKARDAVRLFDVVESVDRIPLAEELARRARAAGREIEILLQIDLAGEPQKGGAAPRDVPALVDACARLPGLSLVGLMTLPPLSEDPEESRPYFSRLRQLRDSLATRSGARLQELSMGMSADFEVAIEEGATWVRLGTAIFGAREGET